MRQRLLLIALIINTGCGAQDVTKKEQADKSTISVDNVVATVPVAESQNIETSPLFSLLWSHNGCPLKPADFPIDNIISRISSKYIFVYSGIIDENVVKILDPETGREILEATIPESILQNHRTLHNRQNQLGGFKYAICRYQGEMRLLVQATQYKYSGTRRNRQGSGIGTALYCCSTNGEVLWTFLGSITHNMCVVPLDNKSDVIVISQDCKQIVLLSASGIEVGRINTPTFNSIEIKKDHESGVVKFYLLADQIYCYSLEKNLLTNSN